MGRRLAWVAAAVVGLAAGGFAFHFPGSFDLASPDPAAAAFGLMIGAIHGLLLGLLLRMAGGHGGPRLLASTVVLVSITHALHDGLPAALGLPVVALLSGLAAVSTFAVVGGIRERAWLLACFVGWAGGLVAGELVSTALGLPASETPLGWAVDHAVVGAVAGLVWGGATASAGSREVRAAQPAPGALR